MNLALPEHTGRLARLAVSARRIAASALVDLQPGSGRATLASGDPQPAAVARDDASWSPLLFANAVFASGFASVAISEMPSMLVAGWAAAALATSLLPFVIQSRNLRIGKFASLDELWAALLGSMWLAVPVLFFDIAGANVRVLAVALMFAISSIGSLALTSRPRSAILFCAMETAALVLFAAKLGGLAGVALGFMAIFAGIAAMSMILRNHDAALQRAAIGAEVKKQNEIIALLLNDFSDERSDWLWETGRDGRIVYASRGLAAGLGLAHDALVGRNFDDLFSNAGNTAGWHNLQSAMLRRKPVEQSVVELPFARGRTWWQITARPIFAEDGSFLGYRGVAHDITDEHRTNQQLLEEKEAAERSSATKSQFLAVMSHELRTPLNAIVGFAELLGSAQAEKLSYEARADHLRTIRDSSKHLQNLINDILDATRIEKGTMKLVEQETDAAELVEVAVKMCREAAERTDNTVIAHIVDGVEIRGDMTRLKQVLINLITNALKFSPAGGYVNVAFEKTDAGGLVVLVRDDGVGIRSEDLNRIFEPYVQADEGMSRRFGGAGLGLAIAKRIATLHGGDIVIESRYGIGTTARLILPPDRVTWPENSNAAETRAA